ncbi:MAG: hypothetical protein HQK51_01730 [Oligoflexia bacterium]|nr:hypothetical protein [Oligoflexia bacterium]
MKIESKSKNASFEILPVEKDKNAVCFYLKAINSSFTGELSEIWIDKNNISKFCNEIDELLSKGIDRVLLTAYSDFNMEITRTDNLGHVKLKVVLENLVLESNLTLTIESDFSYLSLLSDFFKRELVD